MRKSDRDESYQQSKLGRRLESIKESFFVWANQKRMRFFSFSLQYPHAKPIWNCGAGVTICMAWGGMREIGQLHTYIHTYILLLQVQVHQLHTDILLLQVHQYTHYIHTTITGTPVHTLHTYILLLQLHRYILVHYTKKKKAPIVRQLPLSCYHCKLI